MSKAEAAEKAKTDPKAKPKLVAPPMPERPAYAMAKSAPAAKSDRRGFMEVLFGSALAIGFSLAREWRGSLISSIVMHGIHNTLITCVSLLIL